ncbi:hypothetical protein CsatB_007909 [Cannabis sativa]|uniref:uncharacterized protein LOC115703722 n=1 Tax=Cannabis sativa TaxID=3483 RepID=UPI0029C9F87B|nr:uncharacterized protein LOC115703722 [Cannabis sativa]
METIMCVIQYGGYWTDDNNYQDYTMTGLLIPTKCSLKELVELVKNEINCNTPIEMNYQLSPGSLPMKIISDNSLLFYIELRKKQLGVSDSPLCITRIEQHAMQLNPQQFTDTGTVTQNTDVQQLVLQITNQPSFQDIEYEDEASETNNQFLSMSNIFQVADNVADFIIEKTEEHKKKRNEEEKEIITDHRVFKIEEGQIYKDKKMLKCALCFYAILHNFQFKTKRSEPREYLVTCIDDNCNWLLRASKFKNTTTFKVRKYVQDHKCSLDVIMGDHRQANSNIIGEIVKKKFLDIKRIHRPKDIVMDTLYDYGVSMGYQKAWRAREKALELARGRQDDSYQQLPMYLHMLKVSNPGTITHLETDTKNRFKYLFLAFANSIRGWKHCRPVIVTDGTFLKTSFGGTLFSASTMDANNNIFILAFGIGDSENDDSWDWFFNKIRETFGDREGLTIISDRHKSIEKAVKNVYPDHFHGACIFHLLNNIKSHFGGHGDELTINFVKAAKTYRVSSFEHYMSEIDKIDIRIRPYLENIGHHNWTRSHCPTRRYTMMTSNIAESINSAITAARSVPITLMIECLRSLVQKWVWKNGNEANGIFTEVSVEAETVLRDNLVKGMKYQVEAITTILYQVKVVNKGDFTINLLDKTCTCRRFQQDQIPCAHAIAVFAKRGLKTYDYVADYYKTSTMRATYDTTVHPLPNESEWRLPESLEKIVMPPKTKKTSGRPRKKRIRSRGEPKVVMKCSRCGQLGHNRRTCNNPQIYKQTNRKKQKMDTKQQ